MKRLGVKSGEDILLHLYIGEQKVRFATFMIEGQVELTGMCNLNLCVQDLI